MKRDLNNYMRLFFIVEKLFNRYDPCKGCTGCASFLAQPYDCCKGCPFNGPKGCTTYSIACKLWLCDKRTLKGSRRFQHQRRRLKKIAISLNFHYARAHPLEVLLLSDKRDMWFFYHSQERRP